MNPLFLGNPDDHCPRCGTNLRANAGQHLRPCPLCDEPEDAAPKNQRRTHGDAA